MPASEPTGAPAGDVADSVAPAGPRAGKPRGVPKRKGDGGGLILVVHESHLSVEPGAEGTVVMSITNTGSRADEVRFRVEITLKEREIASFAEVVTPVLHLDAKATSDVTIQFTPARDSTVLAGCYEWCVRAESLVYGPDAGVAIGTVEVEPFAEVSAQLVPDCTTGWQRRFHHHVRLHNHGNVPWQTAMVATGSEQVNFRDLPDGIVVAAGQVREVPITAQAGIMWFGKGVSSRSFRIALGTTSGCDAPEVHVAGTRNQRALLPL